MILFRLVCSRAARGSAKSLCKLKINGVGRRLGDMIHTRLLHGHSTLHLRRVTRSASCVMVNELELDSETSGVEKGSESIGYRSRWRKGTC